MAQDLKEYWRDVRKLAGSFDPVALALDREEEDPDQRRHLHRSQKPVWIISLDSRKEGSVGGQVVSAFPYAAAERIVNGTHRLANEAEIKAEIDRREDKGKEIAETERLRKQTVNTEVNINPEQFGAAVGAAMAAAREDKKK